ncbi:MAG: hypothetical protein NTU41_00535 [Chloroflexi bacterium]|nr:hypothetical protein [Chloroflexota bacterium]
MRDQWYGDARDLVKWGVLLHLAGSYSAKRILQVAYFQGSEWGTIEIDGQQYHIPKPIINHFRDLRNILKLSCEPRIEILDSLFEDRGQYKQAIADAVVGEHPCIVFLDPDTGLEPRCRNTFKHVLDSELEYVWNKMAVGDVLAFYQHQTNRNGQPWIKPKREQFEKALRLPRGSAKVAFGSKIASDVVIYYCRKGAA